MTITSRSRDASMQSSIDRSIRVASVPAGHVYVRHLSPPPASGTATGHPVRRLADPDPDDVRRSAVSRWWPPAMLEADWVRENAETFDLMHLQFGFDARTPEQLAKLLEALRDAGKPLVYTVHDLRNPHHDSRDEHDAQLDVLIPGADRLITLTPGAAAEISGRWGRTALVLPHPHVVDLDTMERVQRMRHARSERPVAPDPRPFTVGLHVKSLRASMDPVPVIRALADLARVTPGIRVRIDGHRDVLEPGGPRFAPELAALLQREQRCGSIELHVHDFFSDAELWEYLASLDASVLPYRFGTHSGWLEACRDLGTAVVAPDCGFYAEQGPVHLFHHDESGFDAGSLQDAVRAALQGVRAATDSDGTGGDTDAGAPLGSPADIGERLAQRERVAAAHLALYRELVA